MEGDTKDEPSACEGKRRMCKHPPTKSLLMREWSRRVLRRKDPQAKLKFRQRIRRGTNTHEENDGNPLIEAPEKLLFNVYVFKEEFCKRRKNTEFREQRGLPEASEYQDSLNTKENLKDKAFGEASFDHLIWFLTKYLKNRSPHRLISQADIGTLIQAHAQEILLLRRARKCSVRVGRADCEAMFASISDPAAQTTFDFFQEVGRLRMSKMEYALLQGVIIFTACDGLEDVKAVQEAQGIVMRALLQHTKQNCPTDQRRCGHLMSAKGNLGALAVRIKNAEVCSGILNSVQVGWTQLFFKDPSEPYNFYRRTNMMRDICYDIIKRRGTPLNQRSISANGGQMESFNTLTSRTMIPFSHPNSQVSRVSKTDL